MRRASVVAPLLLISIGALFLARNLYPDLTVVDYLARYWPLVLVAWGALRLIEILFWAASSKPLPPHGISGGEWVLVIFLCIFGVSLHTVRGFSRWWPNAGITMGGIEMFGESFEYPIAAEKASSPTPVVVIESFRGNARVTGADAPTVKVTGRKIIRSLNQGDADRADQDTPFELTGDNSRIVVRNNQDRLSGVLRETADMEITVPKGATIEAHGRNGDFDLAGINGNIEITSDNAGVRLQDLGGNVRVDLRRSDIVRASNLKGGLELKGRGSDIDVQNVEGPVTIAGTYTGVLQFRNLAKPLRYTAPQTDLNIEKVAGEVRMALGDFTASDLIGPVHLAARSRDVQVGDFTNTLDIALDRGDITLRPGKLPLGRMDVHTRSGDIDLSLPPEAKFDLNASTERGDVTNDFGASLRVENQRRGATLRGSVGGGPSVTVATDRGQVVVRKSSGEDTPVAPRNEAPKAPEAPRRPTPPAPLRRIEQ